MNKAGILAAFAGFDVAVGVYVVLQPIPTPWLAALLFGAATFAVLTVVNMICKPKEAEVG